MFSQIVLFQQCYIDRTLIGIDSNSAQGHCCDLFKHNSCFNSGGGIVAPRERPVIGNQYRRDLHRVHAGNPLNDNFAGV